MAWIEKICKIRQGWLASVSRGEKSCVLSVKKVSILIRVGKEIMNCQVPPCVVYSIFCIMIYLFLFCKWAFTVSAQIVSLNAFKMNEYMMNEWTLSRETEMTTTPLSWTWLDSETYPIYEIFCSGKECQTCFNVFNVR